MKTLFTSLLALGLCAGAALASAAPNVIVYNGKTLSEDNLTAGNWGGGTVEDSTDLFLVGGHSLKVTTFDFYQGVKIDLLTPAALSGGNRMLQVTLQRNAVTLHYDPATVPGAVQANPQTDPNAQGSGRGGRRRGGFGGGGFGGGAGGFQSTLPGGQGGYAGRGGRGGRGGGRGTAPTPLIPLITKLRLEFTLTDGRKADIVEPILTTEDLVAGAGWYSVNVPLSALKFGGSGDEMLKSMTLAGDQFGVFSIGQMEIKPFVAAVPEAAAPAADPQAGQPEEGTQSQPGQPGAQPFGQQGGRNDRNE